VHCYRMLGSLQDAEDALHETLLAGWQGLDGFEARASVRTWLYRIATNRCLNARRSASRRLTKEWDMPAVEPPEPTRFGEIPWLEPYPDSLLEGAIHVPLGREARYAQTEAISLAFVSALQVLPRRQLGVLILRDVLGFRANEVADMLDTTVESVNSALKRARASVQRSQPSAVEREPAPTPGSTSEQALVDKFARAYESGDVDVRGPGVDARQRSAGLRRLPSRRHRHSAWQRPIRPHPRRRPDLRLRALRQQRAPVVRGAAIAARLTARASDLDAE